jgi:hypothetical protein
VPFTGKLGGDQSRLANLVPGLGSATSAPGPPNAPSALSVASLGYTSLRLTWQDNSDNETGFVVERSDDGGSSYSPVHTTAANTTTWDDTGLDEGTAYWYRVLARNDVGDSAYCAAASGTTDDLTTQVRVSQVAAEAVRRGSPGARTSQVAAEVVRRGAPLARASQVAAEVIRRNQGTVSNAAISQVVAEVVRRNPPAAETSARTSQVAAEVVRRHVPPPVRHTASEIELLQEGAPPAVRATQTVLEDALQAVDLPAVRATQTVLEDALTAVDPPAVRATQTVVEFAEAFTPQVRATQCVIEIAYLIVPEPRRRGWASYL